MSGVATHGRDNGSPVTLSIPGSFMVSVSSARLELWITTNTGP
jgi:hypothetical protein